MPDGPDRAAQAARSLAAHPWIDSARVDCGVVRIRPAATALAVRPVPGPLVAEYLEHWGDIYDWIYANGGDQPAELDLSGWRASDTGQPFPAAHMADWADRAADLALCGAPGWVLEVGCGTGMLAHRLRGHVRGYVGTDLVPAVLASLRARVGGPAVFVQAAAHELGGARVRHALGAVGTPPAGPDLVLLNSVVQYFPHVDYLGAVLHEAISLVAPGGRVVIGDVRHAGLRDRYRAWLERAGGPGAAADPGADTESELLVDPVRLAEVLAGAAAGTGRTVRLAVHPKLMRADTELTRYRFDAVALVDPPGQPPDLPVLDWSRVAAPRLRLEALADRVTRGPVRVPGIPNRLLADDPAAVTPYQLRVAVTGTDAAVMLDPADPEALAVVAPAGAAGQPVERIAARGPGTAHEPFVTFVRRRLRQVAREVLRAAPSPVRDVPVTVETGPAGAAPAVARGAGIGVERPDTDR